MEINLSTLRAAKQQKEAAEAREENNKQVFQAICDKYGCAGSEANYSNILEFCQGNITEGGFEFMIRNAPHWTLDWASDKQKLLDSILDLLVDPYGRRMTPYALKGEAVKMSIWTRQQLRLRLAELTEKQRLAGKSVAAINEELKAKQRSDAARFAYTDQQGMRWPKLLSTIVLPGQVQSINTTAYLRELHAKTSSRNRQEAFEALQDFKRLTSKYGASQINFFLNNQGE